MQPCTLLSLDVLHHEVSRDSWETNDISASPVSGKQTPPRSLHSEGAGEVKVELEAVEHAGLNWCSC